MRELVAIIACATCGPEAQVLGVPREHGVRENVTEPAEWQDARECLTCGVPLTVERQA